jgi:hypothetical protein
VSNEPKVQPTTSKAIVVKSADSYWLIATSSSKDRERRAYRYPISPDESDQLLLDFDLDQPAEAINVPPAWLALFPEGGEIGPDGFGVAHFGKPAADSPVPGARVGDYVVQGDRGAMVVDGGWQPLDEFALAVLENATFKHGPNPLDVGLPTSVLGSSYAGSHWPDSAVEPLTSAPCAELDVAPGRIPHVALAGQPTGAAVSPEQGSEGSIPADERNVTLDRGHGAFVMVGTWDESESDSTVVVDPLGKVYPLGPGPLTLSKLGYDPTTAPVVPDEWTALFDEGVTLSTSAALCPPSNEPGKPQSSEDCQVAPQ